MYASSVASCLSKVCWGLIFCLRKASSSSKKFAESSLNVHRSVIAESSKAFIFQKFAVNFYFGLSLHIFQHDLSLSLENVCDSRCMHHTGFSSAAVVHKVNLPSCVARRPLCNKVNLPSCLARQPLCHKVNLPRCKENLPSCVARRPLSHKIK